MTDASPPPGTPARAEPIRVTARRGISTRAFTVAALIVCLLIACGVSMAASASPDGLEFVAGSAGFLDTARDGATAGSPLADYATAGVPHAWLSVAIAGAIGCAATFGLAWLVGRAAKRRTQE